MGREHIHHARKLSEFRDRIASLEKSVSTDFRQKNLQLNQLRKILEKTEEIFVATKPHWGEFEVSYQTLCTAFSEEDNESLFYQLNRNAKVEKRFGAEVKDFFARYVLEGDDEREILVESMHHIFDRYPTLRITEKSARQILEQTGEVDISLFDVNRIIFQGIFIDNPSRWTAKFCDLFVLVYEAMRKEATSDRSSARQTILTEVKKKLISSNPEIYARLIDKTHLQWLSEKVASLSDIQSLLNLIDEICRRRDLDETDIQYLEKELICGEIFSKVHKIILSPENINTLNIVTFFKLLDHITRYEESIYLLEKLFKTEGVLLKLSAQIKTTYNLSELVSILNKHSTLRILIEKNLFSDAILEKLSNTSFSPTDSLYFMICDLCAHAETVPCLEKLFGIPQFFSAIKNCNMSDLFILNCVNHFIEAEVSRRLVEPFLFNRHELYRVCFLEDLVGALIKNEATRSLILQYLFTDETLPTLCLQEISFRKLTQQLEQYDTTKPLISAYLFRDVMLEKVIESQRGETRLEKVIHTLAIVQECCDLLDRSLFKRKVRPLILASITSFNDLKSLIESAAAQVELRRLAVPLLSSKEGQAKILSIIKNYSDLINLIKLLFTQNETKCLIDPLFLSKEGQARILSVIENYSDLENLIKLPLAQDKINCLGFFLGKQGQEKILSTIKNYGDLESLVKLLADQPVTRSLLVILLSTEEGLTTILNVIHNSHDLKGFIDLLAQQKETRDFTYQYLISEKFLELLIDDTTKETLKYALFGTFIKLIQSHFPEVIKVFDRFVAATEYLNARRLQSKTKDYQRRLNDFWCIVWCGKAGESDPKKNIENYMKQNPFPRKTSSFLFHSTDRYPNHREELLGEESAEIFQKGFQLYFPYLKLHRNAPGFMEMISQLLNQKECPYPKLMSKEINKDKMEKPYSYVGRI